MVSKCSSPNCEEKTSPSSSYSFHHFPSSIYRSRKWMIILKLKHNFKIKSALVCSKHFSPKQYKENGKLIDNAIPDQNLPTKQSVAVKRRRSPMNREVKSIDTAFADINESLPDDVTDDSEDPLDIPTEPSLSLGECSYSYPKAGSREVSRNNDTSDDSEDSHHVPTEPTLCLGECYADENLGAHVDAIVDFEEQDTEMDLNTQSLSNEEHNDGGQRDTQLQTNPFQYSTLDDEKFKYLSGHTKSEFDSIFDLVMQGKNERDFKFTNLPLREQLLLTLMKCRMNFDYFMLGIVFHLPPKKVSEVFRFWIDLLHDIMSKIDFWSLRAQSDDLYTVVLDCTEFPIQKPTSPEEQQITWSSYKNCNTFKALIGTDERGLVTYVSEVYGGAITDNMIVQKSTILDYLKTGDYVLSDRGFETSDMLAERGIILNKPPNKKGAQMSEQDVAKTRAIASRRVHVERVIGLAKTNRIIAQKIPHHVFDLMPKIIPLLFYLVNFKPSICKPVETKCLCPKEC